MALQFYTCYSYGYFSFLILLFGTIFALFFKKYRNEIFDFIKSFKKEIIIYSIVFICTLYPLAQHYIAVGKVRQLTDVYTYLQNASAWIRSVSILDCAILKDFFAFAGPVNSEEVCAGIGIFTLIISLVGLFLLKKHRWLLLFLITFIFFASCEVSDFILWEYLYYLPGANGIRAIIRLSLMGLIVLSIGSAFLFEYLTKINKKWVPALIYIIGTLIIIEQIPHCFDPNSEWKNYSWTKTTFNKQLNMYCSDIPKNKKSILVLVNHYKSVELSKHTTQAMYGKSICDLKVNSLAIWCGLKANKPTINGLSGISYSTTLSDELLENTHFINIPCDDSKAIFNYDR